MEQRPTFERSFHHEMQFSSKNEGAGVMAQSSLSRLTLFLQRFTKIHFWARVALGWRIRTQCSGETPLAGGGGSVILALGHIATTDATREDLPIG